MIQDTSFVIDVLRGNDDALDVLDAIESDDRAEKVSSMTVLELFEGVARSHARAERRREVLNVLASKCILDADRPVMREAGELSGELKNRGEEIGREDCVVAATALQYGEAIVTGDRSHFERVPGLEVQSY